MNTTTLDDLDIEAVRAWHADGRIYLSLADGREISAPADITPALAAASHEQRNNIRILPFSLNWPDIDEDITIESILKLAE
jgi:uncharacterized protein DUF2442